MIPSRNWFPAAFGARVDWFANFNTQFTVVAVSLGFLPADVTAVGNDNQTMQSLGVIVPALQAYDDAVRQFRLIITEGDIGDPTPAFPESPQYGDAFIVPTGIYERLDKLVKRIRVAPAYTDEIGALLGIIPTKSDSLVPEELQPDPSLKAEPGNVVIVDFVRGKTDGIEIQVRLDNNGGWSNMGRYLKSPAILNIPAGPDNLPRYVELRARYVIGNTAVGQYSDTDNIATIP